MRRIVVMMSVSIDGFFEDSDGGLEWHQVDEELHQHFNDELRGMSAFLEGRVTYELMEEFWPTADQVPESTPAEVEFAGIWRDMPKIVYSRTLERVGPNATIVRDVVPEEVRALKAQPGTDMVLGGAVLAAAFEERGLVDGYRLYVHPVVLGRGRPLFPLSDRRIALRLVETRRFGNGVVLLRYDQGDGDGEETR
jgi:dihydrofolate reductase